MSVMAAQAGKDVWCEKPMTRTIGEGKRVMEAINATGKMFRLNTWFRFKDNFYGLNTPVKPLKKVVESGGSWMAFKSNYQRSDGLRLEILLGWKKQI